MIRVFVGCAADGDDAESQAVLEYTLRRHASLPVDITWMRLSRDPSSPFYSDGPRGWQTRLWSTPFSGFRWAVPKLAERGRAIYMDSDIIVRSDIAQLWNQVMEPGRVVMAKGGEDGWRFCVSLWDCEAASRHILPWSQLRAEDGHRHMTKYFRSRPALIQPFRGNWNCIDGEDYPTLDHPDIRAIHYSSEAHQPHLKFAAPRLRARGREHWFDGQVKPHWRTDLSVLFLRLLREAEDAGYCVENYVPQVEFGPYMIARHDNYRSHRWAR